MGCFAGPETHKRRTTQGNCAEMALVEGSLVYEMLLDKRHVGERVHLQILVVGEDEDDIGSITVGPRRASQAILIVG